MSNRKLDGWEWWYQVGAFFGGGRHLQYQLRGVVQVSVRDNAVRDGDKVLPLCPSGYWAGWKKDVGIRILVTSGWYWN